MDIVDNNGRFMVIHCISMVIHSMLLDIMQCGAHVYKIAKLLNITPISLKKIWMFMIPITNKRIHGVYKPTNITGAPHCDM